MAGPGTTSLRALQAGVSAALIVSLSACSGIRTDVQAAASPSLTNAQALGIFQRYVQVSNKAFRDRSVRGLAEIQTGQLLRATAAKIEVAKYRKKKFSDVGLSSPRFIIPRLSKESTRWFVAVAKPVTGRLQTLVFVRGYDSVWKATIAASVKAMPSVLTDQQGYAISWSSRPAKLSVLPTDAAITYTRYASFAGKRQNNDTVADGQWTSGQVKQAKATVAAFHRYHWSANVLWGTILTPSYAIRAREGALVWFGVNQFIEATPILSRHGEAGGSAISFGGDAGALTEDEMYDRSAWAVTTYGLMAKIPTAGPMNVIGGLKQAVSASGSSSARSDSPTMTPNAGFPRKPPPR